MPVLNNPMGAFNRLSISSIATGGYETDPGVLTEKCGPGTNKFEREKSQCEQACAAINKDFQMTSVLVNGKCENNCICVDKTSTDEPEGPQPIGSL